MVERKDVMRSDRFKQVMLELDQSFDEKEIGFSKFNRFLTEAASRGILSLEKAANGQYEVALGSRAKAISSGDGTPEVSPAVQRRLRLRRSAPGRVPHPPHAGAETSSSVAPPAEKEAPTVDEDRLRGAYGLLSSVTAELARPGAPVRDSEVKRRMLEQERKFDEAALGFSKFSRFLRQAHDEGIIDLERGPEGNYLISPIGGAAGAPAQTSGKGTPAKATDAVGDSEAKSGGTRRGRSERSDRGARPDRDRDRGKKPDSRPEKTVEVVAETGQVAPETVEVVAEKLESTTPVPPEPTSGATPSPLVPSGWAGSAVAREVARRRRPAGRPRRARWRRKRRRWRRKPRPRSRSRRAMKPLR